MKDDQKALNYLAQLKDQVEKITMTLPEDFSGRVYVRRHSVVLDLQGPRLGVFTLVLGGEAPELVYDEQYVGLRTIPAGLDEVIEFAEETIDDVATFVLSSQPLVVYKSPIFRRSYLCIPSNHGPEWKLKRFS
ncbi:hypothetical protein [Glutamicibacter sp.]|jgi:hypothetical protein|uniref:hypothetical protein n=1 Tax=Glutamicibacter sp. TaxID=1931995 RepID=UPI002B48E388|nr:hypothetical protein [Glutamicibacter sp.]HJX78742.1 hypothetical protein [Glutamicibacter sp.]